MDDIRYLQRFENFEKAYLLLQQGVSIDNPSIVEKAGVLQFFEMTFELAWKLVKDFLEYQGIVISTPREAIKEGFKAGIINQGDVWLDILKKRNMTVHTYDQALADEVFLSIKKEYFPIMSAFYLRFREEHVRVD